MAGNPFVIAGQYLDPNPGALKAGNCRTGTRFRRIEEGEKTHELALVRRHDMASGKLPAGNCQDPESFRSELIENLIGFGLRRSVERHCGACAPALSIAGLVRL